MEKIIIESEDKNDKEVMFFKDKYKTTISQIGGKGFSLYKMAKNNINIPSGFILTVNFFQDWKNLIKMSKEWNQYIDCI